MTPRPLPLPPGWTEETLDGGRLGVSEGRFAWSARASRQIVYFRRFWLLPVWPLIWPFIRDHERGHAWGVPASGCLAGRSDCLMSEEAGGRDSWWGKIKLWPRQALRLGRPCPACAAFIAGAAGSLIASALGCEPTPEAVQAAVATSPDALVRLREVEAAERGRLLDWQAEQLRAELANTQDARAREVSMVQAGAGFAAWGPPAAISLVVVAGFFIVLWAVMSVPKVGEPLLLLLGSLSAAFGGVVNYYLGSSLGSSQKTAMLTGAKDAAR